MKDSIQLQRSIAHQEKSCPIFSLSTSNRAFRRSRIPRLEKNTRKTFTETNNDIMPHDDRLSHNHSMRMAGNKDQIDDILIAAKETLITRRLTG